SSDMHLAYSLPGSWYMTHIQAPGLDVSGVALPGAPGVMVGHNQRIAWGITNLQFGVQDLYIEQFDDRTGRYSYRGQVEQARPEREIIRVKGQPAYEMVVWVTRHGPLYVTDGNDRMALRWAAAEPGIMQYPILDIDRAQDWRQFTAALARFPGPGSNFVYADTDGNIGYHVAGKLPKRRGYKGDVPVDGSSGDFDWDGMIPFEQLPAAFNPPGGIVASANQNTFPVDYPYPVTGNFAAPGRARQIRDLIAARGKWRAEDLLAVQKDVYSGFNKFLATRLVAAYDRRRAGNPAPHQVVPLLRPDGQGPGGAVPRDAGVPLPAARRRRGRSTHERSAVPIRAGPGGAGNTAAGTPRRVVPGLRRDPVARPGGRRRGSPPHARPRPHAMAVRRLFANRRRQPGDPSGPAGGEVLRYRPRADERRIEHREADHPHPGAFHAHGCRPGRLGPLTAERADRPIRPDLFQPLQRPVVGLVLRPQLPHAVSPRGGEEYAGVCGEVGVP